MNEKQAQRIIGFDLARAYAIFGMYIVNYNIVFGDYSGASWGNWLLSLFSGNSSTVFVMLAGMGIALMSNRSAYSPEEKKELRRTVNKRAWFLFALGLLFYLWWPADILHFYGAYMHFAALLLFADKRYYLYTAALAVIGFHVLILLIPFESGWNFNTLQYTDFWTVNGFLRNTFYNGWNPVFPWLAYFVVGMYLGRLDWTLRATQKKMFLLGMALYLPVLLVQWLSRDIPMDPTLKLFIQADYLPPFLPFVVGTLGFGLMLIALFMFIGKYVENSRLARDLANTGKMTLTHYISHLSIGIILFSLLSGKKLSLDMIGQAPLSPLLIFSFAFAYFLLSFFFSKLWSSKFKNGPLESLMRRL
jgi:uncharacterized protein